MSVFLFYYEENGTALPGIDQSILPGNQFVLQKLIIRDEEKKEHHGFLIHDGTSSGAFFYNDVDKPAVNALLKFILERVKKKCHPCFLFKFINDVIGDTYSIESTSQLTLHYDELVGNWRKYVVLDQTIKVQ